MFPATGSAARVIVLVRITRRNRFLRVREYRSIGARPQSRQTLVIATRDVRLVRTQLLDTRHQMLHLSRLVYVVNTTS